MKHKFYIALAILALLFAMLACGDFNDSSPMLDGALHVTEQEVR